MDTKYIESLVPVTARPYLREYLRMERVESDKELLAVVLPLIPYDERADLVFESYLNVAGAESEVISRHVQDIANALQKIKDLATGNPELYRKLQINRILNGIVDALPEDYSSMYIRTKAITSEDLTQDDIKPIYDDASMKAYLEYLEAIKLLK